MISIDEKLKLLTGLEKLQFGINAARNNEPMSKGNKTNYSIGAKLSEEVINSYIELEKSKNKKPNIKSLVTYSKQEFIQRGYKVQLYPTKEQEELLIKYIDAYRWTYNYLYADRQKTYRKWRSDCLCIKSHNWFTKTNKLLPKIPSWSPLYIKKEFLPDWMKNITAYVITGCIKAFPKKPSGFRKKGKALNEFCIHQGDTIKIGIDYISIPLIGEIKQSRPNYIPQNIKVSILGVSFKNNKWYAGISGSLKIKKPELKMTGKVVGVDVGIRKSAVSWNGSNHSSYSVSDKIEERLFRLEKSKVRWQRVMARRANKDSKGRLLQEQSKRYVLAKEKVNKIYSNINNILGDNTHQISSRLTRKDTKDIIIEDLNVKGMLSNGKVKDKKLSRKSFHKLIAKAGMSKLLGQIIYKSSWRGIKIIKVNRFFPSSKLCSSCNLKNQDLQSEEAWICPNCSVKHNRDENASKNLQNYINPCWNGFYKNLETVKVNKRSSGLAGSMGQAVKSKKLLKTKPKRMNKSSNTII